MISVYQFAKQMHTEVTKHPSDGYLLDKWGIDGMAIMDRDLLHARTVVKPAPGSDTALSRLAEAHELGHLQFFEDRLTNEPNLTWDDLMASEIWFTEVDAWLRALDYYGTITVTEGQFILDCLYSYSKAYSTNEEWWEAKLIIAGHGGNETTRGELANYKPLEPPVGTPPPSPGFDIQDLPEGDPEERERQQENVDQQREKQKQGAPPPSESSDVADVEKLMLTPEGLAAAAMGEEWLSDWLASMGHTMPKQRPPVVEALLAKGVQ
jgi:hypothetical protein